MNVQLSVRNLFYWRCNRLLLQYFGSLVFAGALPCMAANLADSMSTDEGLAVGQGKTPVHGAQAEFAAVAEVREDGGAPVSGDLSMPSSMQPANEPAGAPIQQPGSRQPLAFPQCTICLMGTTTVSWNGSTGSFRVDQVVNKESVTTGPLRLTVIMTVAPLVWGQAFMYYQFSDHVTLNPLPAGYQYNNVSSGTVNFYGSSIPSGTYYPSLYLEENVGGTWSGRDAIAYSSQATCNGLGCTTPCAPGSATICLQSSRVKVAVSWQSQYNGQSGQAVPIPQNDGFAYFYFSDANNPEVFVKVLDFGSGGALCFVGSLTDFYFKVTFTVNRTGQTLVFEKPAGQYIGFVDNGTLRF